MVADLIGEVDRHAHQLRAGADEMAHGVRGIAFDAPLAVPTHANELSQGLGIIPHVGLVPLQGGGGPGMPRIQADDREAKSLARVVEPRRQRTGPKPTRTRSGA